MTRMSTFESAHGGTRGWRRARWLGVLVLLSVVLSTLAFGSTAQAASSASSGPCTSARRGVALALPALVRIATIYQGQLTYTTADGSSVTFPQGGGTYQLTVSGTGAFISGTGDVLTASSAVSADDATLNLLLAQRAAPDIAQALNDAQPGQTVTAADILAQLLADPQSWQPSTQESQSVLYLSGQYSGQTEADSVDNLQSFPLTVVAQSSSDQSVDNDLTILHVDGLHDLPTIPLGDASQVYQGDTLTILGYPSSADLPQSDGTVDPNNFITASVQTVTVSAFKTTSDGSHLIQVDGDVEQGDGGAPALNADGQLVGIVSLGAGGGNGAGQASFLHTATDAKDLAKQAKVNTAQDTFDTRWAAAYDACASSASGHWHTAYSQFAQIAREYPDFKGVQPYVTYTKAQSAHEPAPGLNLPVWALILIVVVVLAVVGTIFVLIRQQRQRRQGTYAGYGPGLYQDMSSVAAGYSPDAAALSAEPARVSAASEQVSATAPIGGFDATQPDPLTPPLPDFPPS